MPALDEYQDLAVLMAENRRLRGDLLTIAGRINHDLRTPLGSITTAGEMLKEIIAENNPKHTALVAPVFTSADEVVRLLERVSFLLRASVLPEPRRPVSVGPTVSAVLERLESRILARRVSIVQPPDWPEVSGVARWVETIWWNLLANALQHGGKTSRIRLGWRESTGQVRFWVEDDGNGVSAEARPRLFQPFNTLHELNGARGLGLSIVQRLAELQGGSCGYEPMTGGGAGFYFTLPAVSGLTEAPSSPLV